MLLSPGSFVGPYEIIAPLGAGGMGEVYRAKDARLSRQVAVKVISGAGLNDPKSHHRFEREARAASGLNHPNILTVHDIGVDHDMPFIVSELVPGETLRRVVSRGPVLVRELLNLAVQIADALAAAHEAGIVHRDLKPENIMVTPEGRVKILDFGMAKAAATAEGDSDATVTMGVTEPGAILGTPSYMSPEQARSAAVDYRSDQFSFGLVLYEMATGRQAFRRETAVQTLSAILAEEAPAIDAAIPPPLRWIIERCLKKDPRLRYGATSDLHKEIACLREHLSEISNATPASAPHQVRAKNQIPVAVAVAVALVPGVLAAWLWWHRETTGLASQSYLPLAVETAAESFPAWSPDGKTVAYSADVAGIFQIFTRSLESALPAQITKSTADCLYPFWSSSGSRIYYISRDAPKAGLWSVGAAGGEPDLVVVDAIAAAMSPDGSALAFLKSGASGVWTCSKSGADSKKFADLPASVPSGFIRFSPDGRKLACWVGSTYSGAQFWVFPYPGGGDGGQLAGRAWEQRFLRGARPFSWMPDSEHIVFEARQPAVASYHLWISDLNGRSIQPLTTGTVDEAYPAVSPDGKRIAFMVAPPDWDLVEIPVDGSPMRTLLSTPGYESWPAWSPRNEQIAYSTTRTGAFEIWFRSMRESWDRPLVTNKDFGKELSWYLTQSSFSPDGRRIAYVRNGAESFSVWISTVEGGPPVLLAPEREAVRQDSPTWSPDGNWLAFVSTRPGVRVLAKSRASGGNPPIDLKEVSSALVQWSPRGDWLLCQTAEGLALISPDGKSTRTISKAAPITYGWSKDGDRVYGVDNQNRHLVLLSIDIRSGRKEKVTDLGLAPLDSAPYLYFGSLRGFSMAPDGKSFAASILRPKSDIWVLEGFHIP